MNEFFVPGSVPATNAPGASATIRAEFANVAAAFDKLPVLAGNANELVAVNPSGTGLITSGFIISDLVTATGVQALTNKTLSWAGNTWVGFGTAATKTAGTGAGEVLLLAEANKLPTLDAGNLVNLNVNTLGVVPVLHGGTGATTLGAAQTALGIDLKADAINAVLSGAPTCPTPGVGDNSSRLANTFFVNSVVAAVGGMIPSNTSPLMDGLVSPGVSAQASRADHVHPTDTSRAPLASPAFTGNPTAPTPTLGDNDTSIATTAFVIANAATVSSSTPLMDGSAAPGVATTSSRADHVHPSDTSRAPASAATASGTGFTPAGAIVATNVQAAIVELDTEKASLASPAFTGNPTAPTPAIIGNDTSIATTAFVQSVIAAQPVGMLPSSNLPVVNGTASAGAGVTGSRDDHVHPTDTTRASASTLTAHTSNTSNPHSVTKAQVGLGSVDNTSDATKNSAVTTLTNKTLDAANCKLGAVTGVLKATAGVFSAAAAGVDYVTPGGSLGTPSSGNLANCTFPTLNQNTTGTAATANTLGTHLDVYTEATLPAATNAGEFIDSIGAVGNWPSLSYGTVVTTRGYFAGGGGGTLQMYTPYSPTMGGKAIKVRFGNYDVGAGNSWTAWKDLISSDMIGSGLSYSAGVLSATAQSGVGVGQTWQNMLVSRVSGTTYTNSTGRPILVNISGTTGAIGSGGVSASVAGLVIATSTVYGAGPGHQPFVSFVVPDGATYSATYTASGGGSLTTWAELR